MHKPHQARQREQPHSIDDTVTNLMQNEGPEIILSKEQSSSRRMGLCYKIGISAAALIAMLSGCSSTHTIQPQKVQYEARIPNNMLAPELQTGLDALTKGSLNHKNVFVDDTHVVVVGSGRNNISDSYRFDRTNGITPQLLSACQQLNTSFKNVSPIGSYEQFDEDVLAATGLVGVVNFSGNETGILVHQTKWPGHDTYQVTINFDAKNPSYEASSANPKNAVDILVGAATSAGAGAIIGAGPGAVGGLLYFGGYTGAGLVIDAVGKLMDKGPQGAFNIDMEATDLSGNDLRAAYSIVNRASRLGEAPSNVILVPYKSSDKKEHLGVILTDSNYTDIEKEGSLIKLTLSEEYAGYVKNALVNTAAVFAGAGAARGYMEGVGLTYGKSCNGNRGGNNHGNIGGGEETTPGITN